MTDDIDATVKVPPPNVDPNAMVHTPPPTPSGASPQILQPKDPVIIHQNQKNLADSLARPRNAEAEATMKARDALTQNPRTGTQAVRADLESVPFTYSKPLSANNVNQTMILAAPGRNDLRALYKPESGLDKVKRRAGIDPTTTGKREVAASMLAESLGIGLVPPTTMITYGRETGSAQLFQKDMIDGRKAGKPPRSVSMDPATRMPKNLPDAVAEDWQLMDDLLMHGDRHPGDYMLRLNTRNEVEGVALIDNGLSLFANPAVVAKSFPGPREGKPISALNQARLRRMIENEHLLRNSLNLEGEALDGLFARAKALLARGTYGDFQPVEINAHLPPPKRFDLAVDQLNANQ